MYSLWVLVLDCGNCLSLQTPSLINSIWVRGWILGTVQFCKMILKNIQEERESLKKDLKKNMYKYFISIIFDIVILFGGGFIFWYIEQCYDPAPIQKASNVMDQNHFELCNEIKEDLLNSTLHNLNYNQTDPSSERSLNLSLAELEFRTKLRNLTSRFCQASPKSSEDSKECSLNLKDLSSWWSFTWSIAFTIGNTFQI